MARNFEIKTTFRAVDRTSKTIGRMQSRLMKFTARASMALRRLDRVASKLARGFAGILKRGAFIAAGAATGLYLAINRTADSMDALAKKSRAIDFPIEEFQEWRFVAEQSGVEADKFEKGLATFNKRLGKLRGGFGPLTAALKKTNPELAKQLKTTENAGQAMEIMVKAIQEAKGAADKSMLADAAFGVTKMSLIAGNTTEQLAGLRNEMRANGVVTADQAAKAEAYNDMMNRLKLTVSAFVVESLTPLMPMLTQAADSIRKWMVANKELINTKITEFIKKLPGIIEKIVYWAPKIAKYVGIFYAITAAIKVANAAMWLMNKAAGATALSMAKVGTTSKASMGQVQTSTATATKGMGKLQGAMGALTAFVIGWEIGTILHDKLVEPLMKARHEANLMAGDLKVSMGVDLSKRGVKQLENYQREAEAVIKQKQGSAGEFMRRAHGMGKSEDLLKAEEFLKKVKTQLAVARSKAKDNEELLSLGGGRGGAPEEPGMAGELPTGTVIKSTEHKEVVDININDKTTGSKVEIKGKRSGGGLNLVHTGAAP